MAHNGQCAVRGVYVSVRVRERDAVRGADGAADPRASPTQSRILLARPVTGQSLFTHSPPPSL